MNHHLQGGHHMRHETTSLSTEEAEYFVASLYMAFYIKHLSAHSILDFRDKLPIPIPMLQFILPKFFHDILTNDNTLNQLKQLLNTTADKLQDGKTKTMIKKFEIEVAKTINDYETESNKTQRLCTQNIARGLMATFELQKEENQVNIAAWKEVTRTLRKDLDALGFFIGDMSTRLEKIGDEAATFFGLAPGIMPVYTRHFVRVQNDVYYG